jgi:hypothetical protein
MRLLVNKLTFKIVGIAPLLMHNGRLADKSDPYARAMSEISSKRKKVDADYEAMARLEFLGGLYLVDGKPCIPSYVFEATIIGKGGAARKERMGKEAAAALWVLEDALLEYDGPTEADELWEDKRFVSQSLVRVQQSRVTRTRPIFKDWAAEITLEFDEKLLDEESVRRWVEVAGEQCGLMDWRPRFGRFSVEWNEATG